MTEENWFDKMGRLDRENAGWEPTDDDSDEWDMLHPLDLVSARCGQVLGEFDIWCRNRTCHYRHAMIGECLKLARRMARELNGVEKADRGASYRSLSHLAWCFKEFMQDAGDESDGLWTLLQDVGRLAYEKRDGGKEESDA